MPQLAKHAVQPSTQPLLKSAISHCAAFPTKPPPIWIQGLKVLQPRIQAWLGRAAGSADALVTRPLTSGGQVLDAAMPDRTTMARWDPDNKLSLAVPFPEEQTLTVWLDKTLPQVLLQIDNCMATSVWVKMQTADGL